MATRRADNAATFPRENNTAGAAGSSTKQSGYPGRPRTLTSMSTGGVGDVEETAPTLQGNAIIKAVEASAGLSTDFKP